MVEKERSEQIRKQLQEKARNLPARNERASRGEAMRASRRNRSLAEKIADRYQDASADKIAQHEQHTGTGLHSEPVLKVVALGGQNDTGGRNMIILEYGNDALVIDTGNDLGIDLPGINFAIPDTTYLEKIKHKVRGYVYSHGHLDHIAGAPYIVPKAPAPIYGSRFTVGMIQKQFDNVGNGSDYTPQTVVMNEDNNDRVRVGVFTIELVRVTHSIPGSNLIVVDTPVGRIINTGDFRIDPEPLDDKPTDLARIKQLGQEGVLMLMSESTNTSRPGRTPTEHTLEQSIHDILTQAPGRVFIATFSSNINRVQMIISGSVAAGRKVAMDGRSMLQTVELAVKLGVVKIPKGMIVPIRDAERYPDNKITIISTGNQGEPNSALQRMSTGEHNHVKLKQGDTVVLSSTPIPGNEVNYSILISDLMMRGATVFNHRDHEIDGCGPLHVSGHAHRDEYAEMISMVRPKFFMPIWGEFSHRKRHADIAREMGIPSSNITMASDGQVLEVTKDSVKLNGRVPIGTVLVDQTGSIVPNVVIRDRLVMSNDGIVVVMLTLDQKTKHLLTSPDIITRGFIHIQGNEELMINLRNHIKRFAQRRATAGELDKFKQELRDEVSHFLYSQTNRTPIVITVVNAVGNVSSKPSLQPEGQKR